MGEFERLYKGVLGSIKTVLFLCYLAGEKGQIFG